MVKVHATHPGLEVDGAGGAGAGHLGLRSGFLELWLLHELVLGWTAARDFFQDGAVGLVVTLAGLHQHPWVSLWWVPMRRG